MKNNLDKFKKIISVKEANNYVSNICKKCKGACCKECGCGIAPSDIAKPITKELIKELLDTGFVSIDWWEGNVDNKDDMSFKSYFLRIRNVNGSIVDPSWGGQCILLTDKGCLLEYNHRPKQARLLIPGNPCKSFYGKDQNAKDWLPYHDILDELYEEMYNDNQLTDFASIMLKILFELEDKNDC